MTEATETVGDRPEGGRHVLDAGDPRNRPRGGCQQTPQQKTSEQGRKQHPHRCGGAGGGRNPEAEGEERERLERLGLRVGEERHAKSGEPIPQWPLAASERLAHGRQRRRDQGDEVLLKEVPVWLDGRELGEGQEAAQGVERQQDAPGEQDASEEPHDHQGGVDDEQPRRPLAAGEQGCEGHRQGQNQHPGKPSEQHRHAQQHTRSR